ncbi:MAG: hypothetical protein KatS3mg076_1326 [Candidatus Binatia bacterium]|nr:MAG: hypothetical protein KatS3mg076_1326 [Candidatus Binatia bacterium]
MIPLGLERELRAVLRRRNRRLLVRGALFAFAAASLAGFLATWASGRGLPLRFWAALFSVAAAASVSFHLLRRPSLFRVALLADRKARTESRLATALWVERTGLDSPLAQFAVSDALARKSTWEPVLLPERRRAAEFFLAAAGSGCLVAAWLLSAPTEVRSFPPARDLFSGAKVSTRENAAEEGTTGRTLAAAFLGESGGPEAGRARGRKTTRDGISREGSETGSGTSEKARKRPRAGGDDRTTREASRKELRSREGASGDSRVGHADRADAKKRPEPNSPDDRTGRVRAEDRRAGPEPSKPGHRGDGETPRNESTVPGAAGRSSSPGTLLGKPSHRLFGPPEATLPLALDAVFGTAPGNEAESRPAPVSAAAPRRDETGAQDERPTARFEIPPLYEEVVREAYGNRENPWAPESSVSRENSTWTR